MKRAELLFDLPDDLIAQRPAAPRDASRLMVIDRGNSSITHHTFRDLPGFLRPGDCLVLNDTRVVPARFFLRRASGGRVEALFVHESTAGDAATPPRWRVQLKPSARLRVGEQLQCETEAQIAFEILERHERGAWTIAPAQMADTWDLLNRIGETPLPPYIALDSTGRDGHPDATDLDRYQTVYARDPGAVAAPTAGLHFTPQLLDEIRRAGISIAYVTLHVGPGTFTPIDADDLREHRMHAEQFSITRQTIELINATRQRDDRVIAVGTTSARVLETVTREGTNDRDEFDTLDQNRDRDEGLAGNGENSEQNKQHATATGWTDIFIYPPYSFHGIDAMLTNFHLPGSTLVALVMALGGVDLIRRAYEEAVAQRYRFYSYGDAMFIV